MESREIDARVAREVMGFKEPKTPGKRLCPKPHSTDMNAAMAMAGKLRDNGWMMALCTEPQGYSCEFWKDASPEVAVGPIFANTPALAICLAALEAVKSDR